MKRTLLLSLLPALLLSGCFKDKPAPTVETITVEFEAPPPPPPPPPPPLATDPPNHARTGTAKPSQEAADKR